MRTQPGCLARELVVRHLRSAIPAVGSALGLVAIIRREPRLRAAPSRLAPHTGHRVGPPRPLPQPRQVRADADEERQPIRHAQGREGEPRHEPRAHEHIQVALGAQLGKSALPPDRMVVMGIGFVVVGEVVRES